MLSWIALSAHAEEPCYGWSLANHAEGQHLSVEWDDMLSFSDASRYVVVGEEAWETFVGLGFPAPVGAPAARFTEDALGRGGYTDTVRCGDQNVARIGVFYHDAPSSEATLAHELFHAVQYAYQPDQDFIGNYYLWPWWSEATANWSMIEAGFGPLTWSDSPASYLAHPNLALHQDATAVLDPDRQAHMYGAMLFAAHLADREGVDAIDGTFRAVQGQSGELVWFPDVIASMGIDWDELWDSYLAALPTLTLPLDTALLDRPEPLSRATSLPAIGEADRYLPPQGLGFGIHEFTPEAGGPDEVLTVTFEGDPEPRWHVLLVRTDGKRKGATILETVKLEVGADGVGEGSIALDGENPVFLVASPEGDDDDGFAYHWSADGAAVVEEEGCGCATGGPGAGWWVWLAALGTARARGGGGGPDARRPARPGRRLHRHGER